MFGWLGLFAACGQAAEPLDDHEPKAGYIFNFVQFTQWPEGARPAGEPLRICAPESSSWHHALQEWVKRGLPDRRLAMLPLVSGQLAGCEVIILDGVDRTLVYAVRRELSSRSVLVIGDEMDLRDGVMIAMRMDGTRPVFDIDVTLARQTGLQVSSRLLKLARLVQ